MIAKNILQDLLYLAQHMCLYIVMYHFGTMFYFPCNLYYKTQKWQLENKDANITPSMLKEKLEEWLKREKAYVTRIGCAIFVFIFIGACSYIFVDLYMYLLSSTFETRYEDNDKKRNIEYYLGFIPQWLIGVGVDLTIKLLFLLTMLFCFIWYKKGLHAVQKQI